MGMIAYKEIRDVHLEISSLCNAACPLCPRTFWGYPYNSGYPETNLTLVQAQKIFSPEFLCQLVTMQISGNFGDIVMNPQAPDIVEYFLRCNPNLQITISTNGSARGKSFWQRLSHPNIEILFALDGLEDTHHLYRQNTNWKRIIKNAQTVIQSGGRAVWRMINFDHNRHQIETCRNMSNELGFSEFALMDDGRNKGPVFDRHGDLVHVMGDYQGETDFKVLFYKKTNDQLVLSDVLENRSACDKVDCETQRMKSIYIAANGDVYPCCWTAFYPKTYGHGQYHQPVNRQIADIIDHNNALEKPLEQCIQWFDRVERSWSIKDYQQGRLVVCDDNCGCG